MRVGRRTVLGGAAALTAFALAGCRAPALFAPPPTVVPAAPPARVALVYLDSPSLSTAWKEAQQTTVRQAVEAVAAAGRVSLDPHVTLIPQGGGSDMQALEAALGGQGGAAPPDLLVFGDYLFSGAGSLKTQALGKGLLRPLDDLAASSAAALRDYYPGALATGRWLGKLYALPLAISVGMVLYDPTLFRQAGLEPPDASWDWQRMLDASARLTKPPGQYAWAPPGYLPNLQVFLWQNGTDILSPDGQRCVLDELPAIAAATFYGDLFSRYHVVAPPTAGFTFTQGKLAGGGTRAAMAFVGESGEPLSGPLVAVEPFHGTARATTMAVQFALGMAARTPNPTGIYPALAALATGVQRRSDLPVVRSLAGQPSPSPAATPGGTLALAVRRAAEYGRAPTLEPDLSGPFNQSLVQPLQQGTATAEAACRQAAQEITAVLHTRAGTPGPV